MGPCSPPSGVRWLALVVDGQSWAFEAFALSVAAISRAQMLGGEERKEKVVYCSLLC